MSHRLMALTNIETLHLMPGELVEHNREAHAIAALIVAHLSLTLLQWVWLPSHLPIDEYDPVDSTKRV